MKRTKDLNSEELAFNISFAIFWWFNLAEVSSLFQASAFSPE